MTEDEIRRVLDVSKSHALCLSIEHAPSYPGYVRSVYLYRGNRVRIEYEVYGLDEGGAYFEATYPSLADAVSALAVYLRMPAANWHDAESSGSSLERPEGDVKVGHKLLESAIRDRSVPLPGNATFSLQGYWKRFEDPVSGT